MDSSTTTPTDSNSHSQFAQFLQRKPIVMQLLRYAAIGLLNTGLNLVITNLISKYFGITEGSKLGFSSGVGFILATVQSYYWNKHWAFGEQSVSVLQNLLRLIWVGLIGLLTLVLVYIGSQFTAPAYYYFIVLILFAAAELVLWYSFKFSRTASATNPFLSFFIVSLVGFLINFFVASKFSAAVHLTSNGDLNKNSALVVATAVSLIWNFIGYKLIVFKK